MCILFIMLLKVVSHYDLSVLSESVMGFNFVLDRWVGGLVGWWVGGWVSYIQFCC